VRVEIVEELPLVSVLMPILNEESNLPRCLSALAAQDYPKERLQLLIADGGSTDRSLDIVREFQSDLQITVLDNSERKEAEWGKALAYGFATGSYILLDDADMWPSSPTLISRMVDVMETRKNLSGVAARYQPSSELSLWSRYLSYDEFQRDPLFQALTPSMDEFVTEKCPGFDICSFPTSRVPPMGQTTMYRRQDIDLDRWNGSFNDIDLVAFLVKQGKNQFGYVRDVGWVHEHCTSLRQLMRKRRRNMVGQSNSYLRAGTKRDFVWLDTTSTKEVIHLGLFAIQANLIIPESLRGIRDSIRSRRWEQLLRPIASIAITDTLVWSLIRNNQGRSIIRRILRRQRLQESISQNEKRITSRDVDSENKSHRTGQSES